MTTILAPAAPGRDRAADRRGRGARSVSSPATGRPASCTSATTSAPCATGCGCRTRRGAVRPDRRLPGAHRPGRGRAPGRARARAGARLPGDRGRPGPVGDLRAQRRARAEPAAAAVPQPGHGGRAAAEPDRQGRDRALPAGVGERADAHLPGAPGGRHPVRQGEPGPRRPGPAAARGDDPADRPPVQRALPAGRSSPSRTRCCRTRRCCSAPTAARCPSPAATRSRCRPPRTRPRG